MTVRSLLWLVLAVMSSACARQPAQCARPLDQMPQAPQAESTRRLVTSLSGGAGCHVALRLPDATSAESWPAARDAALATAASAARSCCAQPRARNVADWPAGATHFDLEFECLAP